MTEAVLDQNLVEVEWGLLGAVGVVITLMIPKATEYFQALKEYGFDDAHQRAWRWTRLTRSTPRWTMLPLLLLSAVGWATAEPGPHLWSREALLLALPLLAQAGFIYAVNQLVEPVPKALPTVQERSCYEYPLPASPYYHDKTVIRFRNDTRNDLYAYWIDFVGQPRLLPRHDPEPPLRLPPDHETFLPTLAGHFWLVSLASSLDDARRSCVKIVVAGHLPGKARIAKDSLPNTQSGPEAKVM